MFQWRRFLKLLGVSLIIIVVFLAFPLCWGFEWSYGQSSGETLRGPGLVHVRKNFTANDVRVDSNINLKVNGRGMFKRVWRIVNGWAWVGGDNSADMGSTGSYEFGWVKLPGTTSPPPAHVEGLPDVKDHGAIADGLVDGAWDWFRLLRSRRLDGRVANAFELAYAPDHRIFEFPNEFRLAEVEGELIIHKVNPEMSIQRLDGTLVAITTGEAGGKTLICKADCDPFNRLRMLDVAQGTEAAMDLPQLELPFKGAVEIAGPRPGALIRGTVSISRGILPQGDYVAEDVATGQTALLRLLYFPKQIFAQRLIIIRGVLPAGKRHIRLRVAPTGRPF